MRTGRLWIKAALGLGLLLSTSTLRAQLPGQTTMPGGAFAGQGAPAGGGGLGAQMPGGPPSSVQKYETLNQQHGEGEAHHIDVPHEGEGCEDCKEESGLYFIGEYLFVQPRRRGQDLAFVSPVFDGTINGRLSSVDWDSNSAYRVGAGYRLGHGLEVGVSYFDLHTDGHRNLIAPDGGALFATMTAPNIDQVTSAAGASNLDIQLADLQIAKRIDLHNQVWLRVDASARFGTIQQKLAAFYSGGTAGSGAFVSSPIRFDGAGVRTGSEATWELGWGLGLYAQAHLSLLTGRFHTQLTQLAVGAASPLVDVDEKFHKVVPITELGLGLAWNSDHVQVRFGYELANFFNMVDSLDFVDGQSFGKISRKVSDISYDGLVFSVGVFF
jgi:hypothetical protein